MKIDRLIGILSILLREDKTAAPELAERFEASRRTVNRAPEGNLIEIALWNKPYEKRI